MSFFSTYTPSMDLAFLIVLLMLATVIDIREHRIPNWLVATGMVIGLTFHSISPYGAGAVFSLSGLAIGMAALFPFYVLKTMGAGDVKLMGAVGAFLGTSGVVGAVLATMIAGGIMALGITTFKRRLPQLLANLRNMVIRRHIAQMTGNVADVITAMPSVGKMPYAVAISAGTLIQLFVLRY